MPPLSLARRAPAGPPSTPDAAADVVAANVARLTAEVGALDLFERLAAVRRVIGGRIVFTTSFGLEDQAIGHAILAQDLDIAVATLDTGRLFPETHQTWTETERRYGRRIVALAPERAGIEDFVAQHGIDGFR